MVSFIYLLINIVLLLALLEQKFRYILYLIPVFTFMFFLLNGKKNVKFKYLKPYILLYLIIIFVTLVTMLYTTNFYVRFIQESIFLFAPLLTVIFLAHSITYENYSIKVLFQIASIAYLSRVLLLIKNIDINLLESLQTSNMSTESTYSFIFGLFAIFFFSQKEEKYFFYSLILAILSFKRIALIALVITLLVSILLNKDFYKSKTFPYIAGLINLGILFFLINLYSGEYNYYITNFIGIPPNLLLQGRQYIIGEVLNKFNDFNIIGIGLGATTNFLYTDNINQILHSDLIKIYLEGGIIIFFIFFFTFYYQNKFSKNSLLLVIYTNILFLSDNVLIYYEYMFLFYLLLYFLHKKEYILLNQKLFKN